MLKTLEGAREAIYKAVPELQDQEVCKKYEVTFARAAFDDPPGTPIGTEQGIVKEFWATVKTTGMTGHTDLYRVEYRNRSGKKDITVKRHNDPDHPGTLDPIINEPWTPVLGAALDNALERPFIVGAALLQEANRLLWYGQENFDSLLVHIFGNSETIQ